MYALDFEYDGHNLSDFGFIICDFNFSNGATTATAGSRLEFNKIPRNRGKKHGLAGSKYTECISVSFDICRDPSLYDDLIITNDEYRDLMRWLNRGEFLKFQIVKEEDFEGDYCWYEASFNIDKITINEKLCGLTLNMETNAPFGYGDTRYSRYTSDLGGDTYDFYDNSDEIGYTYPDISIKCMKAGDIRISNSMTKCDMVIKNCKLNEIITIFGDTQIIKSSDLNHNVANDFNYDFFSIGNSYSDTKNVITLHSPCIFDFWHTPIIKETP